MYPACFYKEDDGFSVVFPDLNYLATQGDSFEDAMEMAVECLAGYLYTCRNDCDPVPAPSAISDIDAYAVSDQAAPGEPVGEFFVNMVSVDVDAYAKEHFSKPLSVRYQIHSNLIHRR
jgi:predicted RNase H-like HicB family nuclease